MGHANDLPQSRNYAFDGLKLLFIFIVAIHHTGFLNKYMFHGYMSVDFFFIVSGYMLMRTATLKPKLSVKGYSLQRFEKIYPHYLFSFIVFFILSVIYKFKEVNGAFFFKGLTEMLMVQNLGIFSGGYNYPCWYISVLFYSGILLYFLLKHLPQKVFYIIGIFCSITVYGYISYFNNGILEIWDTVFVFYLPLWRGIAGIITGMLIYILHQKIDFNKYKNLFCILEVLSLVTILVLMCIPQNIDLFILIAIIFLIVAIGNPRSLISRFSNNSIVLRGIRYEYAIFLNHAVVISVFNKIIFDNFRLPTIIKLTIILLAIVVYSIITTKLVKRMVQYIKSITK